MTRFKGDDNYRAAGVVGGYSSADTDDAAAPTLIPLRLDPTTKRLLVDATFDYTGVQDGEAVDAGNYGTLILGTDGTNYQVLATDSSGNLQVDIVATAADLMLGTDFSNVLGTSSVIGAGTEAGAIRVTIATNSTGVLSIDDNGGALTVDGTVTANLSATDNAVLDDIAANQTDGTQQGMLKDGAGAILATVLDYTNSNPLAVRLTNTDGDYVAAGAGTQYADGDANATPTGTLAMGTDGSNVFGLLTDASGHLQVDVLSGGGGGTLVKDNEAVDLANDTGVLILGHDGSNYQIIATDASGNVQVDLVTAAVTNAGTFAVQVNGDALTALQLIDNAVSGAGFNITQLGGANVPIGAGLEATALRVTLATDSTGVISIDDNGGTITVDGTVTANLSATDNAVLDNIDADLTTIIGHVDGVETLLGTIDTDTGAIVTAIQLLDNSVDGNYLNVNLNVAGTDVASNAGVLNAQTLRVTIATDDEVNNLLGTIDADTGNIAKSINGPAAPTIDSYTHASMNLAAGANQSLVAAPGASKQIWVFGLGFTVNVAGTVSFQDEDDTAVSGIMNIAASSGMIVNPSGNFSMPIWKVATNKALEVDVVTSELDGWIDYAIVSV